MPPKCLAFSPSLQVLVHELAVPQGFRAVEASSRHILVLGERWRKKMLKGRGVTCCMGLYFQESKAFSDTQQTPSSESLDRTVLHDQLQGGEVITFCSLCTEESKSERLEESVGGMVTSFTDLLGFSLGE